ncbi:MAG: F0F1 ATP synthase subunit epsilon [Acidimicrobiales bacterium]
MFTPDGVLFEGETDAVTVRTIDGDATFLSGHIPLVAALVPGSSVGFVGDDAGSSIGSGRSAVLEQGGFVEADGEVVTVSAPVAELG